MNLYLISQSVNTGYDTFRAAVVAAETDEIARRLHPRFGGDFANLDREGQWDPHHEWAEPESVMVELLGAAKGEAKSGVILSDYHPG